MTKVDAQGMPVTPQPDQTKKAKNFKTLHYLRNHTVHRSFVNIVVQSKWLYVNLQNGSYKILADRDPKRDEDPNHSRANKIFPGCWISIASFSYGGGEIPQQLLRVAADLLNFVKRPKRPDRNRFWWRQ